ncbi:MAG: alpha/beta hydrolase [Pseudomonadota bacterium]
MTPLVLLPGMMCDARLFQPQIAALSGRYPIMTVPIGARDSMSALAAEMLSQAPKRFALGGVSMGGIVAMEVLRQAPERVLGLALMDTNPLAESDTIKARRGPQIAAAECGDLQRVMAEDMKPNYLSHNPDHAHILDLCMEMAMHLGPEVFVNQSRALRDRVDQSETLRAFDRPALVLCGREDRLCPPERHTLMHRLVPQSKLVIIEDAGHLPCLEKPEETTAALTRWLEEI